MLTWNRRDSTPLSAAPQAPKGDQGWIFWSYKSLSGLPESGPYRIFVLVFNWNHFEMRLLNLRINFYLLRTFCPHLGSFFFCMLFLLSLRFGQISSLAFFHGPRRAIKDGFFGLINPYLVFQIRIFRASVAQRIEALSLYGSR